MANYTVIVDEDPARRSATHRRLLERIAPFPHLEIGSAEVGSALLVWAIPPEAPHQLVRNDDSVVLRLGHVVARGPDLDSPAARPAASGWDPGPVQDGFHIAIRATALGEVFVRPDLLGLLPVYYASPIRDVFLAGSSPYLFPCHPSFVTELELRAIVGLLLANTMVNGRSIYRGVRRLGAGQALQYRSGTPEEIEAYRVPVTEKWHRIPAGECVARLGEVLEDACRRHVPLDAPCSLLLSGGLDSRLLAGMLAPSHPGLVALTTGIATDLEARYARRVTRTLRLRHELVESSWSSESFAMTLRWDALMSSPGTGGGWRLAPVLRRFAPWVVSGYVMDSVFGASVERSYDSVKRVSGFQPWLANASRWGFPPERLRALLRSDVFGDALEETESALAADYARQGDYDLERARRMILAHRMRFHTGAPVWRHTFGAWPVIPAIDRSVFEATGGCPLSLLAGRRLEKDLLCRRFPELAIIPLDQNSYDDRALDPRLRDLIAHELRERSIKTVERVTRGRWRRKERRYYQRTFNFNGPAWRWIRKSIEPDRALAYDLFDRATFNRLLPPADAVWPGGNSIEDAAGMKSLIGILAWLREFSPAVSRR